MNSRSQERRTGSPAAANDASDALLSGGRPSLGEESRAMARARIVEGAMTAMAERGLDVTVDDVAEAARVSRRTVFRHFATHAAVLVAAIAEIHRVYDANMPAPPAPGTDLEVWLAESAVAIHELNRRVIGRAFWDIHVERSGVSPDVTAALVTLWSARDHYADELSTGAWRVLGGRSAPPRWVIDAFVLQLSAFATNAMASYSTQEAGRVSAQILSAVLAAALAESLQGKGAGMAGQGGRRRQ